ncbi:MAG: tetratricopeptide repeat protein [Patescibacteria group bacterium]
MDHDKPVFPQIKTILLSLFVFLFPLFFLPITQDFFILNKLYLTAVTALSLILLSAIEILVTKKIVWQQNKIDKALILFTLAVGVSTLIVSPNKVQALLNGNFGLVQIMSLAVITFYLARVTEPVRQGLKQLFLISCGVASVIAISFFFQPFKSVGLPSSLAFLKTQNFNTVGNLIDLSMLLGFAFVVLIASLLSQKKTYHNKVVTYFIVGVVGLATVISLYTITKPLLAKQALLPYPPLRLSWTATVDTLKNPVNALFGVGPDNFAAIFTREKDVVYNQSTQWQISSFNVSRSGILQILTEGGLLSIIAFALIVFVAYQQIGAEQFKKVRTSLTIPLVYAVGLMLLFPPSLIIFFIFFLAVASIANQSALKDHEETTVINASTIAPIYITLGIAGIALVMAASYFLGRVYLAEYTFRSAIVADSKGDLQKVYDNHVRAIILNPYVEGYRVSFARVNMFIANNISARAQQEAAKANENAAEKKDVKLSDQDKQNITERIQVAIAESKAAVALNPQKAVNWENLAALYRNLLTVAEGADAWTVAAYQRAITIDPTNPVYRINLGGVYYSAGDYNNAQSLFSQAANLKPDWPNAYYNLAWASYQKKDYKVAVAAMEQVLSLLDPKKESADFKKATKDLEDFKKQVPAQETTKEATSSAPQQLALPTPATASVEPKIELPKNASPEANPKVSSESR